MKPRCRYHWGHGRWYAVGGSVSRRQATWRFGELTVLTTCPERWKYPPIDRDLWADPNRAMARLAAAYRGASDPYEEAAKLLWPNKDKPA